MFPGEDTLQPIARIVKSYGTEGDVMVSFQDGISDILKTEEPVWLFYDGLPVPFYIQNIQFKGLRKAILHLEDIDSHSDAEEAAGKDICIDPAGYPELSATDAHQINEDGLTLEDLTGFTLLNQDKRTVGVISDVMDFSGNICLEIEDSGSLIPYHDDLLLDIDPDSRTITLRISDGLL
jgi:16S rRNA processing protein RimM